MLNSKDSSGLQGDLDTELVGKFKQMTLELTASHEADMADGSKAMCVSGEEVQKWIMDNVTEGSSESAADYGQCLVHMNVLNAADGSRDFNADESSLYKVCCSIDNAFDSSNMYLSTEALNDDDSASISSNRSLEFDVEKDSGHSFLLSDSNVVKNAAGSQFEYRIKNLGPQQTPILVFINKKSGGQQGSKILESFRKNLHECQVYDLSDGGPKKGLLQFKDVPKHFILACGGDGTVGWVLSVMDTIDYGDKPKPPVAIIPLGTGNDLSRVMGWGAGAPKGSITERLSKMSNSPVTKMDRWNIDVTADDKDGDGENKHLVMNNYMSIGVDAKIALMFHEDREANPKSYNNQTKNKMMYVHFSSKAMFARKKLCDNLVVFLDGKQVTISKDIDAVIVLNIPSYSAGADFWGKKKDGYAPQTFEDGLVELVGVKGVLHMGRIQAKLSSGIRLGQGKHVMFKILKKKGIAMQVDGEPWKQKPAVVNVSHLNQANMLIKVKKTKEVRVGIEEIGISEESLQELTTKFVHNCPTYPIDNKGGDNHHAVFFIGSEAVDWIMSYMKTEERNVAWKVGQTLMNRGYIRHITSDTKSFRDNNMYYIFTGNACKMRMEKLEDVLNSADLELCRNLLIRATTMHPDVYEMVERALDREERSLHVEPFVAHLEIDIIQGFQIKSGAKKYHLLAECGPESLKAKSSEESTDPMFDKKLHFVICRSNAIVKFTLVNRSDNSEVGYASLPVSALLSGTKTEKIITIAPQLAKRKDTVLNKDAVYGRIQALVTYNMVNRSVDPGSYFGPEDFVAPGEPTRKSLGIRTAFKEANHICCQFDNIFVVKRTHSDIRGAFSKPHKIEGLFQYFQSAAFNAEVEVFISSNAATPDEYTSLGVFVTCGEGKIQVELPAWVSTNVGHYKVRMVMQSDYSLAQGSVFIVERGTGCIVYDIDGTLTPGDEEVVQQALKDAVNMKHDIKLRRGAVSLVRSWAAKGFLPLYVSGRAGSFYNLTREWLVRHGFPAGAIHHTADHAPTLPVYASVGVFKLKYMQLLKKRGLDVVHAYGNTATDMQAYTEFGMKKEHIFGIGGRLGSDYEHVYCGPKDYTEHLSKVWALPDATIPIPHRSRPDF